MSGTLPPHGRFGDYSLLRRLTAGGMGEIWLAERRGISGFSKRVVIKTILECFADEPSLVEMFLEEGRVAAGLNHPNIAQTYDLGRVGDTYYIAMEYVRGRDLRSLLLTNVERGQLIPLNLVLRIVAETCEGLYYAHTWRTPDGMHAGIIHRDISPQNVLVTFDGRVKIIDFGIAKAAQSVSRTRAGVLKGKYAYMSPEQVRSEKIDHRSDLFSLGVVMYELVTARRLFKRTNDMATLDAVLRAEVPAPTRIDGSVPKPIEDVLLKALAKNVDQRYLDARRMQLAIEEVMLNTGLPASSAHLAAYAEALFQQDLAQEIEREQESLGSLRRGMESLPGVADRARPLERTNAFAPGLAVQHGAERLERVPAGLAAAPRRGVGAPWKWTTVALLALIVAVTGWFLVDQLTASEIVSTPIGPEPRAPSIALDRRAPAEEPAPDDETPQPEKAEPMGPRDGQVLDPIKPSEQGQSQSKPVASAAWGRLSVETEPPADIYLGRRRIGRGVARSVRVKAGEHRLKVVARPGSTKRLKLVVPTGRTVAKRVVFQAGKLRVVVLPWANVKIDGRPAGQTPMAPIELLEGTHRIELSNPSLEKEDTRSVKIQPGQETLLRLDWR